MKQNRKIGVLTGGGDCPGLNTVIRALAKALIYNYSCEVYGFKDGFRGLIESDYIKLDMENISGLIHKGGTILGTTNRDNPFSYPTVKDGQIIYVDMSDTAVLNMNKLGVDALVVLGGDGSLNIAKKFADKGVNIIGVPKTIDNDLMATDLTFGFNTAMETAVDAIDKLHTTAESHHRVMVLEVMGRYAGWIALESGIAGGADIILIPEIPYDINKACQKIIERKNNGKNFSIVVVAEGAKPLNGEMTIKEVREGTTDPVVLGGIGQIVAKEINEITKVETRITVLGHLQRGGAPNAFDRLLSTRYGVAAAELVANEKYNTMVALKGTDITYVNIEDAIQSIKNVPVDGELVRAAKSIGINLGN